MAFKDSFQPKLFYDFRQDWRVKVSITSIFMRNGTSLKMLLKRGWTR